MKVNSFSYEDKIINIASIADLHINAKNLKPKRYKKELKKYFLEPLERALYIKGLIIAGDVFHDEKIYLEDDNSKLVFWLFDEIYKIASKRDFWVRVIKGTESHDRDSLEILRFYEDMYDFKIYNKACVEKLDNLNILFLPEEYHKKPEKYYKPFLNVAKNTYDLIVMHGLVKEMEFFTQDNEVFSKKSYAFDVGVLCDISKGPILAGHIHTHTVFREQFIYIGSFSRFTHGEEKDKGMVFVVLIKDETEKYIYLHHKNEMAQIFIKLVIDFQEMDESSLSDIIEKIENFIKETKATSLDLRMNYIDTKEAHAKVSGIIQFYKFSDIVKIRTKISTLKNIRKEEEQKKKREENSYIIDKSLSFYEVLQIYIKKTTEQEFSISTIEKFFRKN